MHTHTCTCGAVFQCGLPCWNANEEMLDCGACPQGEPEEVESPARTDYFESAGD